MEFWRFIKGFEGAVSARLAQPTAAAAAGVRLAAAKRAHLVWEFVPEAVQEFTSTKFQCDLCFALHSFDHAPKKRSACTRTENAQWRRRQWGCTYPAKGRNHSAENGSDFSIKMFESAAA